MDEVTAIVGFAAGVLGLVAVVLGKEPPELAQRKQHLETTWRIGGKWDSGSDEGHRAWVQLCLIERVQRLYEDVRLLRALAVLFVIVHIFAMATVAIFKGESDVRAMSPAYLWVLSFLAVIMAGAGGVHWLLSRLATR